MEAILNKIENFIKAPDSFTIQQLVKKALEFKNSPFKNQDIGKNKTLILLFFNPSLRTRLSTKKAAINLGMSVIDLNINDGWKIEFEDQVIMNTEKAEHIKEAAKVISQYGDIIGIRSFPSLANKEQDEQDFILQKFIEHAEVPVISLESATRHPLQSLADLITIEEHKKTHRPKVVLTWVPHPKALPHSVANSFTEWMNSSNVDFVITHPEGYDLSSSYTENVTILHNQNQAFKDADFIYAKNWSSFTDYGQIKCTDTNWMITEAKMALTNEAYFMHCLPVRRNVIVKDKVLDSNKSLVIQQSNNRTFATQAVLNHILKN